MSDNAKLDVVRKLLAKAEGTDNPLEAETYTAKAVALMAQYGLDEALVNQKRAEREVPVTRRISIDGAYSMAKGEMLAWIAQAMRGKGVLHHVGKRLIGVSLVGFASDLDRAELVWTSLLLQAANQVKNVRPEYYWGERPSAATTAAYRRSWYRGFASKVSDRIQEAEEAAVAAAAPQAAAQGTSMELVLVDRSTQVELAYEQAFPRLGKPRKPNINRDAYRAGSAAGARADIGGKSVGGSRKALV